jgi:hypothetical protein
MGRRSADANEPSRSRNVRVVDKATRTETRLAAVVIESADDTCTVVGTGIALRCRSIQEAMVEVDQRVPRVLWREATPGFWVGRSLDETVEHAL